MIKYKLSKVELNNFRIFSKAELDFLNSEEKPYDFICIYGENGTGKTSFVDSLEWLSSGKLHRIDEDMGTQGNNYKGAILTNEEAYKNKKFATVKAYFKEVAGSEVLERERKIQKMLDKNNDYRGGIGTATKAPQILSPKQVLPHSLVARFVSASKPKDRFKTWTELIDPNENSFKFLTNTYRLKIKIKELLEKTESDLTDTRIKVENLNILEEIISKINEFASSYNDFVLNEEHITLISRDSGGIYLIPDLSIVKALKIQNSDKIEMLSKNGALIARLKDGYGNYVVLREGLANNINLEKDLNAKINRIKNKIEYMGLKARINSQKTLLIKTIEDCINEADTEFKKEKSKEIFLNEHVGTWISQIDDIDKEQMQLNNKSLAEERVHLNAKLKDLESNLLILDQLSKAITTTDFKEALKRVYEMPENDQSEILSVLNSLRTERIEMQKKVEEQNDVLAKIKTLESENDLIKNAVIQVRTYISRNKLAHCPVCSSDFDDTESLLSHVDEKYFNKELSEMRVKYQELQNLLDNLKERYDEHIEVGLAFFQKKRIKIEDELKNTYKAYQELAIKETELNTKTLSIEKCRKNLKTEINGVIPFSEQSIDKSLKILVYDYEKEIQDKINQADKLKEALERLKTEILIENDDLLTWKEAAFAIPTETKNFKMLGSIIDEIDKNMQQLNVKMRTLANIDEINIDELSEFENRLLELLDSKKQIEHEINNYNELLYESGLNEFVIQKNSSEETDNKILSSTLSIIEFMGKRLSEIDSEMKSINSIIIPVLDNILRYESQLYNYKNDYRKLLDEETDLRIKSEKQKNALDVIEELYERIRLVQQDLINQAFDEKRINQFYRVLEPHKEFPKLKFYIEFDNEERPGLYIKAGKEDDGNLEILPELIFSTAQLNTVSLCMFLSNFSPNLKLSSKTLIMDDPISNFDDINTVAFSDLLRTLCTKNEWQIILTTHDEKLFRLLQVKLSSKYHNSVFMKFKSRGILEKV